jgi:hypothetical protein
MPHTIATNATARLTRDDLSGVDAAGMVNDGTILGADGRLNCEPSVSEIQVVQGGQEVQEVQEVSQVQVVQEVRSAVA